MMAFLYKFPLSRVNSQDYLAPVSINPIADYTMMGMLTEFLVIRNSQSIDDVKVKVVEIHAKSKQGYRTGIFKDHGLMTRLERYK